MKKDLHPALSTLTVTMTNGVVLKALWTGKETSITSNMDPFNHPAWTGNFGVNTQVGRAAAFLNRYKK